MTIFFALIAIAVAASQAWLLFIQTRQAEVTLSTEILTLWQNVGVSWRILIAVAMHDTSSFYAPLLTPEERSKIESLRLSVDAVEIRPGFAEEQLWLSEHCRSTLAAISTVAEFVLSGRIRPKIAYAVVGLDLVRRSKPLRDVLFAKEDIWLHIDSMSSQRGARDRILALIDLLWVEAAKRHDLSPWALARASEVKRAGSGATSRRRLETQCAAVGANRFTRKRLVWSLRGAERTDFEEAA